MRKIVFILAAILILGLTGCGQRQTQPQAQPAVQPQKATFEKWTPDQVIAAFKSAGLEAENVRPMTKEDYGVAPMLALKAVRFYLPSLGQDKGGRLFSFSNQEDLEKMKSYYVDASKKSALFFSWAYSKDNILVQINGDLKEDKAKQYEAALNSLK